MSRVGALRLGERDLQLLRMLAEARCLSQPQLVRLLWPASRRLKTGSDRLLFLSGGTRGGPWVQRHQYADNVAYHGRSSVWTLAQEGATVAAGLTGAPVTPGLSMAASSLAHHLFLSELYVGMLATPLEARLASIPGRAALGHGEAGPYARADHPGWGWRVTGSDLSLGWQEFIPRDNSSKDRLIRPDALLELHPARTRIFIEAETGSQPVTATTVDRAGATSSKVSRYLAYFTGLADMKTQERWYTQRFPDNYTPEVLFLVGSKGRVDSIRAALAEPRIMERIKKAKLVVRALTLQDAIAHILPRIGEAAPSVVTPGVSAGAVASAPAAPAPPVALSGPELDKVLAFYRAHRAHLAHLAAEAAKKGGPAPVAGAEWFAAKDILKATYEARQHEKGKA